MASLEGQDTKIIDKFKGEHFNLWGIVDKYDEAPSSNLDSKVKNAMSIFALNHTKISLCTLEVAKDHRRHGKHFATSMKQGSHTISSLFVTCCSHAKCNKVMTCWTILTRSKHLSIHLLGDTVRNEDFNINLHEFSTLV